MRSIVYSLLGTSVGKTVEKRMIYVNRRAYGLLLENSKFILNNFLKGYVVEQLMTVIFMMETTVLS